MILKLKIITVLIASVALCNGCSDQMTATMHPEYQAKITPISTIALTGEGATIAFPAFVAKGYQVKDIGGSGDPIEIARSQNIPFIAIVDKVGTDEAVWDGFFKYSMRVTNTANRNIVWSANGKYGQSGILINQVKSNKNAMEDMVNNFSLSFPPQKN